MRGVPTSFLVSAWKNPEATAPHAERRMQTQKQQELRTQSQPFRSTSSCTGPSSGSSGSQIGQGPSTESITQSSSCFHGLFLLGSGFLNLL